MFLYNADFRYALQLPHLSNKTQSGSVTRKSHINSGNNTYQNSLTSSWNKKISVNI